MKLGSKRVGALVKVVVLVGLMMAGVAVAVKEQVLPVAHVDWASAQVGAPDPHIDYIHINDTLANSLIITPGASVTISVQATNMGNAAGESGGIYISFPELDSYTDADYVDVVTISEDLLYDEYRPGDWDSPIWYDCDSGYSDAPEELLVVGEYDTGSSFWNPGEAVQVGIKVSFPETGTYRVYVRASAADGAGATYSDPPSAEYVDQQCRYVYRQTIAVSAEPNFIYLPTTNMKGRGEPLRGLRMQASGCYTYTRCHDRLDCLGAARINTVYYSVYYQSEDDPPCRWHSDVLPNCREFDSLAYLVPRVNAEGARIYALMETGTMGWREFPELNARLNHECVTMDWLDFTMPEARELMADVAVELVTKYEIDGILLDATRWVETFYPCEDLSEEDITLTVKEIHDRVKAVRPDVLITASPHADLEFSRRDRAQAVVTWLGEGYVDYVTPLTYVDDAHLVRWIGTWRDTGYYPERIIPRLAVVTFNPTTPRPVEDVLRQIDICYSDGAVGVALWDDRYVCSNPDLVEALGAGGW